MALCVCIVLFYLEEQKWKREKKTILRLCESAIMIALATVLSMIKFANLPFGGSVTLCSMLPLVLIAYRYKWKWGLLTGVVYGLVQMVLGANNLSYGTSALAVILIILFDYLVAFGVMGFAGIFRDKFHNQPLEIALGAFVACGIKIYLSLYFRLGSMENVGT